MHGRFGPVVFPFTGDGVGGSHVSTFLLAKSLAEDHGVPTKILAVESSSVASEARARGLDVVTVPGRPARRREFRRDLMQFIPRRRILRAFGTNSIVHCSDIWSAQSWGIAAKSIGLPFVYHHRAFASPHMRNRLLLGWADRVVSISDACSRDLPSNVRPERISQVLNPFETIPDRSAYESARDEFVARWPIANLKLVGFSANFQLRKRARYFVEVAAAIARDVDNARFVVFGRDRDETAAELRNFAHELGIADKLHFAGFRSPPERNIASLDILAIPALAEPFGRTLLEAIMLGVPYVATDDAGHGEIGKRWQGGMLVPKHATAEDFAAAVVDALHRTKELALSSERLAEISGELRPVSHAQRILEIYRTLERSS